MSSRTKRREALGLRTSESESNQIRVCILVWTRYQHNAKVYEPIWSQRCSIDACCAFDQPSSDPNISRFIHCVLIKCLVLYACSQWGSSQPLVNQIGMMWVIFFLLCYQVQPSIVSRAYTMCGTCVRYVGYAHLPIVSRAKTIPHSSARVSQWRPSRGENWTIKGPSFHHDTYYSQLTTPAPACMQHSTTVPNSVEDALTSVFWTWQNYSGIILAISGKSRPA